MTGNVKGETVKGENLVNIPAGLRTNPVAPTAAPTTTQGTSSRSFSGTLSDAINEVNRLQMKSADSGKALSEGSAESIHRVVLEAEEASLSMQLMVAVRNKAMDAYQEVMRMQV